MACRWMEGFEVNGSIGALADRYTTSPGAGEATFVAGRLHGTAMSIVPDIGTPALGPPVFDLQTKWIVGFALRYDTSANANEIGIIDIIRQGAGQVQLRIVPNGTFTDFKFQLYRGATLLAETTFKFSLSDTVWYYVEFSITPNTTVGAYELRIDGTTELSGSGVNTADSTQNQADQIGFNFFVSTGADPSTLDIDDIYIFDGSGSENNDFNGNSTVEGKVPNEDGNSIQWTPSTGTVHYQMVDELESDGDTTYNLSTTVGHIDLYGFQNLGFITGNIVAVQVSTHLRLNTAGSQNVRHRFRDPTASEATGSTFAVTSTSYVMHEEVFETNPVTVANWTVTEINNGQFGLEMVA